MLYKERRKRWGDTCQTNSPNYNGGVYLDMALQPGDMQFLKNHAILHGRTYYEDFPEFERRSHLLRLWLRSRTARKQPPETHVHEIGEFGYRPGGTTPC